FGDAEGDLDNIYELQNTYFDISDPEAAAEFLNQHAILAEYWDRRRELIMADPLLQKYMASMDMFERVARDDFNRRMDAKYPNLDVNAFWDEYWGLREVGLYEQADAMWDKYPEMNAYLRDKNLWTLQLREELEAMAAPIEALSPEWARLRADADLQTPGQM